MATVTLAQPKNEPPTPPQQTDSPKGCRAICSGSAHNQLLQLRTHLTFQNQTKCEQARINWATNITKADSYRHITRSLHAKINSKDPKSNGRLTSPEAQTQLDRLAQMAQARQMPSPGDLNHLNWKLQVRIVQAAQKHLTKQEAEHKITRRRHQSLRPRETQFPLDIQVRHILHRKLQQLIRQQGASPKRANRARIAEFYPCPACRGLAPKRQADELGACPHCQNDNIFRRELIEIAVSKDAQQNPIGKPAIPQNYSIRPQEPIQLNPATPRSHRTHQ